MRIAKGWPADALRLDAYDAEAGAVGFTLAVGLLRWGADLIGKPRSFISRLSWGLRARSIGADASLDAVVSVVEI